MDPTGYKNFPELVKAVRKRHRVSQREMARVLGVSGGFIGQWELGISLPGPEIIKQFCVSYGLSGHLDYVQKLAWAQKVPERVRDAVLHVAQSGPPAFDPLEVEALEILRRLSLTQKRRLVDRMSGWAATLED